MRFPSLVSMAHGTAAGGPPPTRLTGWGPGETGRATATNARGDCAATGEFRAVAPLQGVKGPNGHVAHGNGCGAADRPRGTRLPAPAAHALGSPRGLGGATGGEKAKNKENPIFMARETEALGSGTPGPRSAPRLTPLLPGRARAAPATASRAPGRESTAAAARTELGRRWLTARTRFPPPATLPVESGRRTPGRAADTTRVRRAARALSAADPRVCPAPGVAPGPEARSWSIYIALETRSQSRIALIPAFRDKTLSP